MIKTNEILKQLVSTNDPAERARLVIAFGEALDNRLLRLTDNVSTTMGRIEISVGDALDIMRQQMTEIRQAEHHAAQLQSDHRFNTAAKLHTLSNHIMGLEEKINEIAELVQSAIAYEAPDQS